MSRTVTPSASHIVVPSLDEASPRLDSHLFIKSFLGHTFRMVAWGLTLVSVGFAAYVSWLIVVALVVLGEGPSSSSVLGRLPGSRCSVV
jgi:hypothetical protein